MIKLIWMSDPHFEASGTVDGIDPRVRLDTAIDHANQNHPDAAGLVLSGDLVGKDVDADYPAIARHLAHATVPVYPMMGNNDSRAPFRGNLGLPDTAMADFVQYTVPISEGLLVFLDTHMLGSHAGQLCRKRLDWLDDVLSANAHQLVYVFMHHPPCPLGLPPQDKIRLQDDKAFLDLIARHDCVAHLFAGHVHRPTSGSVAGIPFATIGALSFQAPAPRPDWDWDTFVPAAEPPHYAVVLIEEGNVVVQYTQFCDYSCGVEAEPSKQ